MNEAAAAAGNASGSNNANLTTNPLLASAGLGNGDDSNPDLIANLCSVADHRLYKIVKWCKSLPLFKNISVRSSTAIISKATSKPRFFLPDRRSDLPTDQFLV